MTMATYRVICIETGELVAEGDANQCSQQLGLSRHAFYTFVFQNSDSKKPKFRIEKDGASRKFSKTTQYIVKSKNNDLLASGAASQCASALGMTIHSFYSMVSRTRNGKSNCYSVISVRE